MTELATQELARARAARIRAGIQNGALDLSQVGQALITIRDNRLYRAEHATFEAYCAERWGFTDRRARQLIDAAAIGRILPVANAGQAAELARVPEPERAEVWRETVERTEGKPTAAAIRETYERTQTPAPMPEPEPEPEASAGHDNPQSRASTWMTGSPEPPDFPGLSAREGRPAGQGTGAGPASPRGRPHPKPITQHQKEKPWEASRRPRRPRSSRAVRASRARTPRSPRRASSPTTAEPPTAHTAEGSRNTRTEAPAEGDVRMSEKSLPELSPQTRALIAQVEAAAPNQQTPEFTRVRESFLYAQACTSLSDEDATARMNELPCGTSGGWQLTTDPTNAPVPCADNPGTHRHLLFEA